MKKRLLSLLLCLVMVFSMVPFTAFAAEVPGEVSTGGLTLDKKLIPQTDGSYNLELSAYATGTTTTTEDPVALDIALVIDQSGSMVTGDMGDVYSSVNKNWKIDDATGDKVYYYYDSTDRRYYPVEAGTGTVYVEAERQRIYDMIKEGRGNSSGSGQGTVVTPFGNTAYYNIPTDYYYPDSSGVMHHVYVASVGVLGSYKAFPYMYKDPAHEAVSGENGDGSEWSHWITWAGVFHADNLESITALNGRAWRNELDHITWVGNNGQSKSSWSGYSYSWFSDGDMVSGLYKKSTGYNHLYYIKADGTKVNLTEQQNRTVYRTDYDTAYSGILYEITGKTRYAALQEAVQQFSELVAQNAKDTGVDHRMAIIGFAGNEMPSASSGTTPNYSGLNGKWDYVNTGMFVNGNFISYKEITSYRKLGSTENAYINRHYYILDSGTYVPVVCDTNNRWYRLDTYYYVSGTDGTKYYDFYEPVYKVLNNNNGNQYQNAFLSVNSNDGSDANTYNDTIDTAVNKFSAYGGTYTSYGMTMANQVFANNPIAEGENRQRVIIVFTDGEPGGRGFEEGIANEALADSAIAKDTYNAEIYTIGLFTGTVSQQVTDFMNSLSSNAGQATTGNVYGGAQNKVSANGTSGLDASGTYYYTDSEDGKTYAVTTKNTNDEDSLGWWAIRTVTSNGETFNVYSQYVPRINSSDDRSDHTNFYTSNTGNKQAYSSDSSFSTNNTYWVGSSGSRVQVKYEYRWYNSNGRVKDPKTSDSDNAMNHVQFFTVTSAAADPTKGYYQKATNITELNNAFRTISENISTPAIELDPSTSFLLDVISDDFDVKIPENASKPEIVVETVKGTQSAAGANIGWATTADESDLEASYSNGQIKVEEFDFAKNYIAFGKEADAANDTVANQGRKLVVTVKGLTPNGNHTGSVNSNTAASGIYSDASTMVAAFPMPSINVGDNTYVIDFNAPMTVATGAKKLGTTTGTNGTFTPGSGSTFDVTYQLKKSDVLSAGANLALSGVDTAMVYGQPVGGSAVAWNKITTVPASSVYFDDNLRTGNAINMDGSGYNSAVQYVGTSPVTKDTSEKKGYEFIFTGTAIDVYASTVSNGGYVMATLYNVNEDGSRGTQVGKGQMLKAQSNTERYNVPVISMSAGRSGTYMLVLQPAANTTFNLDGIRVYNPVDNSNYSAPEAATENDAAYLNLRDALINNGSENPGEVSMDALADDAFKALFVDDSSKLSQLVTPTQSELDTGKDTDGKPVTIVYVDEDGNQVEAGNEGAKPMKKVYSSNFAAYNANSPKHEIYLDGVKDATETEPLKAGQAVIFQITEDVNNGYIWIGLSAPNKDADFDDAKVKVNGNEITVDSAVDMYYPIKNADRNYVKSETTGEETTYIVKIENTGHEMISLTNLKVTHVPELSRIQTNFDGLDADTVTQTLQSKAFAPLTMRTIMLAANNGVDPDAVVPEEPTVVVEPGDEPSTEPGDEPGTEPGDEPGTEPGDEPGTVPGDEPGTEPTVEPTQQPSITSIISNLISSFVKSLFGSVSRLFGH